MFSGFSSELPDLSSPDETKIIEKNIKSQALFLRSTFYIFVNLSYNIKF